MCQAIGTIVSVIGVCTWGLERQSHRDPVLLHSSASSSSVDGKSLIQGLGLGRFVL